VPVLEYDDAPYTTLTPTSYVPLILHRVLTSTSRVRLIVDALVARTGIKSKAKVKPADADHERDPDDVRARFL
jgi:hypothetical protein